MSEIKGELIVETGIVLPKYDSAGVTAYNPQNNAVLVFDTESDEVNIRTSSVWKPLASKSYVNLKVIQLEKKSMPIAFNGVLPSTTTVLQFAVNVAMEFPITYNVSQLVSVASPPLGGPLTCNVLKNGVVVGAFSLASGLTTTTLTFSANTSFVVGDIFSITTGAVNGASDVSITFLLNQPTAVI